MGQDDCPCFYGAEENEGFIVCADRSLTEIPECVPSDTVNLTISTPTIPLVPETLQRFTDLNQLVISDFNDVVEISPNFLLNQKSLVTFEVRNTSIEYVDNRWFMYAPNLEDIGMINNKIASMAENTFKFLPKLEHVRLDGNKLTTFPLTIFEGTGIHWVTITDNPWHCDCDLMKVMRWLRKNYVSTNAEPALCWQPKELRGLKVNNLNEDIACEH